MIFVLDFEVPRLKILIGPKNVFVGWLFSALKIWG